MGYGIGSCCIKWKRSKRNPNANYASRYAYWRTPRNDTKSTPNKPSCLHAPWQSSINYQNKHKSWFSSPPIPKNIIFEKAYAYLYLSRYIFFEIFYFVKYLG